jgi:excisionase family DNA binding protein
VLTVNEYLEGHPDDDLIEAIGEVGTEDALVIPRATAVMFAQILELLAQGRGVQIFQKEVELSTQQAAAMLNVSRPYLIGRLEAGKIPFRKVGRHRRIRFEDLMDYKRKDDLDRRVAADKLAELTEELDLY